jgi:hypothetical protein
LLQNTKKKTRSEHWLWLLCFFGFSLVGWSCNTREQGCLNPDAANFDLTAEKACDDCCTFPIASITLSQKWGDDFFSTADTFYDIHSQPYKIIDLQYFLSAFAWESVDDILYTVDSTTADCSGQPFNYTKDMNAIRPTQFDYTLGSFRMATEIDSLSFHVGLVQDFSCLEDTLLSTPVILTPSSPLWNPNTGALSTIRLIVNRSLADTLMDTLFIDLHQAERIAYSSVMQRGTNFSFLLTVNYAPWFATVDVMDKNSFSTSIENGIPGSIQKTQ